MTAATEPRMAYTGTLSCGCIVSAIIDNPEHRDHVAEFVAQMIEDGESVQRRPIEEAKADPAFLRNCGDPAHGMVRR